MIELETHYYHDNFTRLINFVVERYLSILPNNTVQWIDIYQRLNISEQRLFVRLISRTHSVLRFDAIKYPELGDTETLLATLIDEGLVKSGCSDLSNLTRLAKKDDLLALLIDPRITSKSAALASLKDLSLNEQRRLIESLGRKIQPIVVAKEPHLPLICLCYFGNPYQNLTEFILSDLGIKTPPKWPIDRNMGVFNTREQLLKHYELALESKQFHDAQKQLSLEDLIGLYQLPSEADDPNLIRRRQHLNDLIAREVERRGNLEQAISLYQQLPSYFSWERYLRCLHKTNKSAKALSLIKSSEFVTDQFFSFRRRFQPQLERSLNLPKTRFTIFEPRQYRLTLRRSNNRVEKDVVNYFEAQGERAFFAENKIINTLVALCFWQVIAADVKGAFYNPYQFSPVDIHRSDFLSSRETQWNSELKLLKNSELSALVAARLKQLEGLTAMLLNPQVLQPADWLDVAEQIGADKIIALAKYLFNDVRSRRSGQPDLLVCSATGQWRFVEVKGPGDLLQDHQRDWFEILDQLDIQAELAWVDYEN